MTKITVPQDTAWRGEFGDDYHKRSPGSVEANTALFQRVFPYTGTWEIATILELGAGIGTNLQALRRRFPRARATAVELNHTAWQTLQADSPEVQAIEASVLDWKPDRSWDLVLTKGLLIHIAPALLPAVYESIHRAAARYVLICEYFNPSRLEVVYRGEKGRLWKADFAGELLDRYKDLRLVNYGFVYARDTYPQDNLTWFLLEKIQCSVAAVA